MDLGTHLRQSDLGEEEKEYTYSRDRAFLGFLLDSEDSMNDEPIQDLLHPLITLGCCTFTDERRELINDP
jgi:hypothetical protein